MDHQVVDDQADAGSDTEAVFGQHGWQHKKPLSDQKVPVII